MTLRLSLVQAGRGTVGGALVDQVAAERVAVRERLGVDLVYAGIAGRAAASFAPDGIDLSRWRETVAAGAAIAGGADVAGRPAGAGGTARDLVRAAARRIPGPKVLIDATADDGMGGLYLEALAAGFHVVACNKKPFAGPLAEYRALREAARSAGRFLLNEVTVGAGLPVVNTLRDLLESGDRLRSIEGCFSGTLNFLCAGLDRGGRFSEVLAEAKRLGYTEPDPREDLAGRDVARKALILAREAGLAIEPDEVRLEPFLSLPAEGDATSFLAAAPERDAPLRRRWDEAAGRGARLRYVAEVGDGCRASLREVPADSPLGRLAGPENVFAFRTGRYAGQPLVVSGPGAGPAVTAAGAFGDLLRVARALARTGADRGAPAAVPSGGARARRERS